MDLPKGGSSLSPSELQLIRAELKQWENEFQMQHSRAPSKSDVIACPHIQVRYRQYARLKMKLGKENAGKAVKIDEKVSSINLSAPSHPQSPVRCKPGQRIGNNGIKVELFPVETLENRLCAPDPSCPSDDSDASYVSDTPPKIPTMLVASRPLSQRSSFRKALQPMSSNQSNQLPRERIYDRRVFTEKCELGSNIERKDVAKIAAGAPKKMSAVAAADLSSRGAVHLHKDLFSACPLVLEGGFTIRLHRHGVQLNDRQSNHLDDLLPAGSMASLRPSSLINKDRRAGTTASNQVVTAGINNKAVPVTECVPSAPLRTEDRSSDQHRAESRILNQDEPQGAVSSKEPEKSRPITPTPSPAFNRSANSKDDRRTTGGDDHLTKEGLSKMTIVGLKRMLLQRRLPLRGNKSTLVTRLEEALHTEKQADKDSSANHMDMISHEHGQTSKGAAKFKHTKSVNRGPEESVELPTKLCGENTTVVRPKFKSLKRKALNHPEGQDELNQSAVYSLTTLKTSENQQSSPEVVTKRVTRSMLLTGSVPNGGKRRCRGQSKVESKSTIPDFTSSPHCSPVTRNPMELLRGLPAGEGHKLSLPRLSMKKTKLSEPLEQNSWANPLLLQKGAQSANIRTIRVRSSKASHLQYAFGKPGERDNFVKLNINGKGGRRRFLNGTGVRRPGAYGRRGNWRRQSRKKERMPAEDGLADECEETHEDGDCMRVKTCRPGGSRRDSLWPNDGWLETATSPERSGTMKCSYANELSFGFKEEVMQMQENPSDENLVKFLHLVFGFKAFRTGQVDVIKRVLQSRSTMVILPTGAGKSLCYQLPALIFPGITLVISPLLALMTDQLLHLPSTLPGALISSAQTSQESSAVIAQLRAGEVKVLFISPERLFSESFLGILNELPEISLAVVDEAHCVSEWSHNFRSSYFRLGKVLHQQMKVSCVLAMTATATKKTEKSILKSLCIPTDGVVQESHERHNLLLSVTREENRLSSLLSMLQKSPYSEAKSIIIYCSFQLEADNVSGFLRKNGIQAKSYHSKKTSRERNLVYDQFCRDKLRVVVATVAFGLGLDKSTVRAVLHYNMPRSLEQYVQEIGRAGRDGYPAYCHLYLDDGDYFKLRSLAYSDGVDEYSVNKFLSRVFEGCSTSTRTGHPGSIIVESAVRELDMKEEVMETILSYLEVGEVEYVKILSKFNATCTMSFHKTSPASLAGRNAFVATIIKSSREKQGRYVFNLLSLATQLRLSLSNVQSELRRLQVAGEISYELGDPALCFKVLQVPEDICLLTSTITKRLAEAEQCKVRKIDAMYMAASAAVHQRNGLLPEKSNPEEASLQTCLKFHLEDLDDSPISQNVPTILKSNSPYLLSDIKVFLSMGKPNLTGRAIARIFHGLWSPAFPSSEWSKHYLWGRYVKVDFAAIKNVAAAEALAQHIAKPNLFHH